MRRGFTLIELMAVLILLSLTTAVAAVGMIAGSESSRLRRAASILADTDAHARQLAMTGINLKLVLTLDGRVVNLIEGNGEKLRELNLGNTARGSLIDGNRAVPLNAIEYNALGQSRDYIARVSLGSRARSLSVCGLTGWVETE